MHMGLGALLPFSLAAAAEMDYRGRERERDRQTEETLENLGANLSREAAPTKAPRSAVSPVPVPWPS